MLIWYQKFFRSERVIIPFYKTQPPGFEGILNDLGEKINKKKREKRNEGEQSIQIEIKQLKTKERERKK